MVAFKTFILFTFKVLWIFILWICSVNGQGTPADKCTGKQHNSCSCKTANGWINLDPIDQAKIDGQPKFPYIYDNAGDTYWYNPCTDFTSDASCTNIAGCQDHGGLKYPIGDQASATFKVDPTNGQGIEYTKTHTDGITRKMFVALMCDKSDEGTLTAQGEVSAEFAFTLSTKYACSDVAPAPAGGGSGGGGLSAGSILLIIFFVLLAVYLIAGVLFMRFYKGATGVQMIPNLEFWTALPGLAKDGALFAWGKITRKGSQRSSYDNI